MQETWEQWLLANFVSSKKQTLKRLQTLLINIMMVHLRMKKGFCAVVALGDVAKQDYILTPGRYVGIAEQEDDGIPFQEKMDKLTTELSDLFAQSHDLEDEIRNSWQA